jgi:hypothetical protein
VRSWRENASVHANRGSKLTPALCLRHEGVYCRGENAAMGARNLGANVGMICCLENAHPN